MLLGSNLTDALGWALGWARYEAPGDLYVKSDMHSDYHISDTPSSSEYLYNPTLLCLVHQNVSNYSKFIKSLQIP